MILIKVEIKGEPDVLPFTRFYESQDDLDEVDLENKGKAFKQFKTKH